MRTVLAAPASLRSSTLPNVGKMCNRSRPFVLAPGAVGQVGALHPVLGVVLERLLAPVRVGPGATPKVGLGVGQPGAASALVANILCAQTVRPSCL